MGPVCKHYYNYWTLVRQLEPFNRAVCKGDTRIIIPWKYCLRQINTFMAFWPQYDTCSPIWSSAHAVKTWHWQEHYKVIEWSTTVAELQGLKIYFHGDIMTLWWGKQILMFWGGKWFFFFFILGDFLWKCRKYSKRSNYFKWVNYWSELLIGCLNGWDNTYSWLP